MSQQITTAFVQQFANNVKVLSQQQTSRLRSRVMEEAVTGEKAFFEQIGSTEMVERTSRHADSPLVNTPHDRRMVTMKEFEWGDLIDNADRVRTLVEFTSPYAQNAARAVGRKIDQIVIDALGGTAYSGKAGTTANTLPSGQQVAVDYVESGSTANSGLTVGKLRKAKQILMANEAIVDGELITLVCSAQQIADLLRDDEVVSGDYNIVRALVNGQINTYMGFDFVRTELLGLNSSTDVRTCYAFPKSAITLAVGANPEMRITERADKSFSTYVFARFHMGAVRMEEEKVVEVSADQSPA